MMEVHSTASRTMATAASCILFDIIARSLLRRAVSFCWSALRNYTASFTGRATQVVVRMPWVGAYCEQHDGVRAPLLPTRSVARTP